ncbi:MAG: tRNA pseudouridine(38-40) synthase TruA [Burkholderiales bacterium]|jgi:tRNA pseudouridine38-40 synthase|nr:tRNA pseudouridine(38-40) synthase TruA [Burkholderiales bacterium]
MPNIALQLEYDGSHFFGFQRQASCRTIQGELEKALSKFANHDIQVITAGRTDTGVHALNQVVNFTTHARRELHGWVRGVNALLPDDIAIKKAAIVSDDFSSRFDATSRTYYYYLCVRRSRPGLLSRRVGWYYDYLDIEKMQEASALLHGQHDFSSFRAANCQANTAIRNMLSCSLQIENNNIYTGPKITTQNDINLNEAMLLRFEFTANAFLYHMVRNLVGALLYVGKGNLSVAGFSNLLDARDRTQAPPTFMPDGLYLAAVTYKQGIFN